MDVPEPVRAAMHRRISRSWRIRGTEMGGVGAAEAWFVEYTALPGAVVFTGIVTPYAEFGRRRSRRGVMPAGGTVVVAPASTLTAFERAARPLVERLERDPTTGPALAAIRDVVARCV